MAKKSSLKIWTIFEPAEAKFLRIPALAMAVTDISSAVTQDLIDTMVTTMKKAKGIGLAAPQIGQSIRLTVIGQEADSALKEPLTLINPALTHPSTNQISIEEGCLSIPGIFGLVQRAEQVTVCFFDRHGLVKTLTASGLLSRVIQHEIDHLNGVLFIDRQPEFTRGQELLP